MMILDVVTLVELVVKRALTDKTVPDSTNLGKGGRTDALMQGVDALLVIKYNNPAMYAQVGRQVALRVSNVPEMKVLAQLAVFRGERLCQLDQPRQQTLVQLAENLDKAVAALPEGTRKARCASLLKYHEGIFFGACGRFDLAAKLQRQSAEEAEHFGDKAGASIAYFCEASDLLKDALVRGEPSATLDQRFSALEQTLLTMSQALAGSALQVQWAEGNGPAHMLEVCIWLNQDHPNWSSWLQLALSAAEKLGEACTAGAEFSRALDAARRGQSDAPSLLHGAATKSDINERKATAFLVMARQALKEGQIAEAKTAVGNMPELGAQHVCAIGKRLLA